MLEDSMKDQSTGGAAKKRSSAKIPVKPIPVQPKSPETPVAAMPEPEIPQAPIQMQAPSPPPMMPTQSSKGSGMPKWAYAVSILSLIAIIMSAYVMLNPQTKTIIVYRNATNSTTLSITGYNITSALLEPPLSYSDSPVITQNQSFGKRLTGINSQFNTTELSDINSEPNSYFEKAGEMFFNHTLLNRVGVQPTKLPSFTLNGKPVVIYLGSTTCVFCGENRWAMALALSRFGNFTHLFKGYSSLGDADLPTIFWAPTHYNTSSTISGDFYSSKLIGFLAIEDGNPISQGFALNPIGLMQSRVNQTNNLAYKDAMQFVINTKQFGGTPFTIWGNDEVGGADGVVFGNGTSTGSQVALQNMTHEQVLRQFSQFKDQFAWSEYAAADFYVAMVCNSISNSASACSLPAIQGIEKQLG